MKARDIMTKDIITLTPETTIAEAIDKIINNKISGAPVLDAQGEIAGVVTEKDLLVAYDFIKKFGEAIKEFMSRDIIGISEETPVEEISQLLVQRNIKRVPVLEGKKVLGIVSRRDVLRYILEKEKPINA